MTVIYQLKKDFLGLKKGELILEGFLDIVRSNFSKLNIHGTITDDKSIFKKIFFNQHVKKLKCKYCDFVYEYENRHAFLHHIKLHLNEL